MLKSFFFNKKWVLWAWGGFAFIIGSLLAQTLIDVKINEWYKGFYDLLQKATEREVSEFYDGIFLFLKLEGCYILFLPSFFKESLKKSPNFLQQLLTIDNSKYTEKKTIL